MRYPPNRPKIPLEIDWAGYWQALRRCDAWWRRGPESFSVFPPRPSWIGMIRKLHPVICGDWSRFKAEPEQQKRILGCAATDSDNWALLGNMLGFAIKPVFGDPETVRTIERTVKSTLARDAVFPETAASAYSSLTALDGIGPGIATRLLTLARPDRCASWNDASRRGLAAYTTPDSASSSNRDSYGNLLRRIHKQPWFSERPSHFGSPIEKEAWSMRVALLDAFIYTPNTR